MGRPLHFLVLLAITFPVLAHASPNLVQNGGFETVNPVSANNGNFQFSGYSNPNPATGGTATSPVAYWSGNGGFDMLFKSNNLAVGSGGITTAAQLAAAVGSPSNSADYATNGYGDSGNYLDAAYTGASPNGGNFIALDGDSTVAGGISQVISATLTPGITYELDFYWAGIELANRSGPTTEQVQASFLGQTVTTGVVSLDTQGYSGWMAAKFTFTATSSNILSNTLSFLAIGTPNGYPPMVLLDGVSLTAVPEPSSFVLLLGGVAALGLVARRRAR